MPDYSSSVLYYFLIQGVIVDNSQLGCCFPCPPTKSVCSLVGNTLAGKESTTASYGVACSRGYRQALCKAGSEMAGWRRKSEKLKQWHFSSYTLCNVWAGC